MRLPTLHGRDELLGTLRATLASAPRVTLLGRPGAGKTRLAQAVVAERTGRVVSFDGVESVEDARMAMGASLGPPTPRVLVLDRCEPLRSEAVAWLDEVIPPSWSMLATSRRPLGWAGEQALEVPPLDAHSARRVFLDAAPTPLPAPELDRVTARLGRLPGALRLAAACLDLVDLTSLESSLGDPDHEVWREAAYERLAPLRRLVLRHFPDGDWTIDPEGAWHAPPCMERRPVKGAANRRVLAYLLEQRLRDPGAQADSQALVRAGWPMERLSAKAAGNRVRVALSTLRSLGLGDLIERGEHGWRLTLTRTVLRGDG